MFINQISRGRDEFDEILSELKLNVNKERNAIVISNNYGKFKIYFSNANISFTPNNCKECSLHCGQNPHNLCIVLADKSCPGWTNSSLTNLELLILSKSLAIMLDYLPSQVRFQMLERQKCPPSVLQTRLHQELRQYFQNKRKI